jgi:hypothetical protein
MAPVAVRRRDAEIEQLGAAARQHHVGGLQIAMHDPGAVREVEGFGDLDGPVERLPDVEPST